MGASTWRRIGNMDRRRLGEARHQAHNAAQWLARVAHSYLQPKPENSHVLLRWDAQRPALVTREFRPGFALELRLPNLALQFKENGRPAPHVIEIDDRTPAEVEAWVLVELLHRGIDRDRFAKALPYEMPHLMTGDAIPYVTEGLASELNELAAWFAEAAALLGQVDDDHSSSPPGAVTGVWCWPEPFHLAVLVPGQSGRGSSGRPSRAGWSPGDGAHDEPYFYVTRHAPRAGPSVDSALTLTEIGSLGLREDGVLDFLRSAIERVQT